MTPAPADPRARAPRIPALDAARAVAVVAMVCGHTLDALLSLEARGAPLAAAYWRARGLTAPVFLVAAGWAVTVAIRRSGARGLGAFSGRLPRVLLLLGLGVALRWPGWGAELLWAGDRAVLAHLLAFDVLHAIAISILAVAAVLALPLGGRERVGALLLLAVASLALGMGGTAPLVPEAASLPRSIPALLAAQALGGTSPFALVPWSAYFLAGAIVGLLSERFSARAAIVAGAAGAAMVLATAGEGASALPPGHPVLFVHRTGIVLVLLSALSAVPPRAAAAVAPLGRASLGIYALHLAVVYGWSTQQGLFQRIGPTLSPGSALLVAAALLAGSFALHRAIAAALHAARRLAARGWERRGDAFGALRSLLRGPRAAGG